MEAWVSGLNHLPAKEALHFRESKVRIFPFPPDGEVANTSVCKTDTRRFESCSWLSHGSVAQWKSSGLLIRWPEVRPFPFPQKNFYISLHPQKKRHMIRNNNIFSSQHCCNRRSAAVAVSGCVCRNSFHRFSSGN